MYEFRDTTASEFSAGNSLSAEAMSFNGKYFENEITGYRTLHVSGREILSSEVQTEDINLIDGSKYYGKRYPARTITVTYQLIAENDTVFRWMLVLFLVFLLKIDGNNSVPISH